MSCKAALHYPTESLSRVLRVYQVIWYCTSIFQNFFCNGDLHKPEYSTRFGRTGGSGLICNDLLAMIKQALSKLGLIPVMNIRLHT